VVGGGYQATPPSGWLCGQHDLTDVPDRGERKPPCEAAEALEDLKVARRYIKLWRGR